jgi:hypothetical protein
MKEIKLTTEQEAHEAYLKAKTKYHVIGKLKSIKS